MIVLSLVFSVIGIICLLIAILLTLPLLRGAHFVPTTDEALKIMIELAHVRPGEKAVDLGSGDGKVVIALAEAGAEAHGYDINLWLVWKSRRRIKKLGLEKKAFIHWGSFWRRNLGDFTIVMVYGLNHIMKRLEKKLRKELPIGARVVSNTFMFPNWQITKQEGRVYLYTQR